jgi:hypothetical protein
MKMVVWSWNILDLSHNHKKGERGCGSFSKIKSIEIDIKDFGLK